MSNSPARIRSIPRREPVGTPLLDDVLRCPGIRPSSRMWLLWSWFSHTSGYVSLSPHWQADLLGVDVQVIRRGARDILRSGMFVEDEEGRYRRAYLPGETPAEFERREQRNPGLEGRLAVAWVLAALMSRTGVARRTTVQLAQDTGRHKITVVKALGDLVYAGIISRYGGHGSIKMTFTSGRADGPLRESLLDRYGPHRESGDRTHVSGSVAHVSGSVAHVSGSVARSIYRPNTAEESTTKLRPGPEPVISKVGNDGSGITPVAGQAAPRYNNQGTSTQGGPPPMSSPIRPKVVELFPDRQPVSAIRRSSGGRFVRQDEVVEVVVDILARVRRERSSQIVEPSQRAAWARRVAQLCRRLDDPSPAERVHRAVRWYMDHWADDEFIPRIESGQSLLDKFDRLEAAMARRSALSPDDTPRDVIRAAVGNGSMLAYFEADILAPARRLNLTSSEVDLARALVDLYVRIREDRAAARLSDQLVAQLGGLTDLLRRYVAWVADNDWSTATLKVLRYDSPSFAHFRREQARLDARERDPITGSTR